MEDKGCKALAYMCEPKKTYDLEIKVGNRSFPAVRSVLESKSEHFRALFSSGMKEVEEGVLTMLGVEADGVEQCISFLHSGQVVLNSENIFETLTAAHLMQLGSVTSICFQSLHEHLNLDNYLTALHACDLYDNMSAKDRVGAFISRHLWRIETTEKFLSMNKDDFVYCLGVMLSDNFAEWKWRIASRWIRSETTRQPFFKEIIQHVSMQFVSEKFFLKSILEEPFIKLSTESRNNLIEEWFSHPAVRKSVLTTGFYSWRSILQNAGVDISNRAWEHMLEFLRENITDLSQQDEFVSLDESSILSVFQSERTKFSSERVKWKAAVKWIRGEGNGNELFPQLFKTMKFERFPPSFMRENIESFPLVKDTAECLEALSTFIERKAQRLATGLACAYEAESDIMALNLDTKELSILAKPESGDYVVGMVNMRGDIYWMGCKTLLKLSGNSKWTKLPSPPDVASLGRVSKVVAFRNRIYLFTTCIVDVHFYDPSDNTWTKATKAKKCCEFFCVASSDNLVWLVGGERRPQAAKYDPIDDLWTDIAAPKHSRIDWAAAVLHEKLYVVGDDLVGEESRPRPVECYDPDTNTWTEISDLTYPRSFHSLCVINDKLYAIRPTTRVSQDTVEVYDTKNNVWIFVRKLCGSGLVYCCSTMQPFTSRAAKRPYTGQYSSSSKFPMWYK